MQVVFVFEACCEMMNGGFATTRGIEAVLDWLEDSSEFLVETTLCEFGSDSVENFTNGNGT